MAVDSVYIEEIKTLTDNYNVILEHKIILEQLYYYVYNKYELFYLHILITHATNKWQI